MAFQKNHNRLHNTAFDNNRREKEENLRDSNYEAKQRDYICIDIRSKKTQKRKSAQYKKKILELHSHVLFVCLCQHVRDSGRSSPVLCIHSLAGVSVSPSAAACLRLPDSKAALC